MQSLREQQSENITYLVLSEEFHNEAASWVTLKSVQAPLLKHEEEKNGF